jgi:two-component system sensor histidine kinase/response regulator
MADLGKSADWLREYGVRTMSQNQKSITRAMDAFDRYRDFLLMTTDIVAIEPRQAQHYINHAMDQYIAFSSDAQQLTQTLTRETNAALADMALQRSQHLARGIWAGLGGLLLMSLFWLLATFWLTRRLSLLSLSMEHLSGHHTHGPRDPDDLDSELHGQTTPSQPLDEATRAELTSMAHGPFALAREMALAVLAFDRSVRARKKAQTALRTERHTLKMLVQGMPDLVWLKDPQGALPAVQPSLRSLGGCDRKRIGWPHRQRLFSRSSRVFPVQ